MQNAGPCELVGSSSKQESSTGQGPQGRRLQRGWQEAVLERCGVGRPPAALRGPEPGQPPSPRPCHTGLLGRHRWQGSCHPPKGLAPASGFLNGWQYSPGRWGDPWHSLGTGAARVCRGLLAFGLGAGPSLSEPVDPRAKRCGCPPPLQPGGLVCGQQAAGSAPSLREGAPHIPRAPT